MQHARMSLLRVALIFALRFEMSSSSPNATSNCVLHQLPRKQPPTFIEEGPREVQHFARNLGAPITASIMVALVAANILHKNHLSFLPESAMTIAVGIILGSVVRLLMSREEFEHELFTELNTAVLNLILLPIIIFESGWSLRVKDFIAQFQYILIFAIGGTVISTFVTAYFIFLTGHLHGITEWRTAVTYSSLISATDPVATLSTYSALQVDPLLNIMVFGESTINDAVAIVVFNILNNDVGIYDDCGTRTLPLHDMLLNIAKGVVTKFFGSIACGVLLATIYILVLRGATMRHSKAMEILFVLMSSFLTYSLAESFYLSGIIAVLFCSVIMGIYARPHLSVEGSLLASFFIREAAMLADMCVFLLVGVDAVLVDMTSLDFALWVMLFCLISRACSIFPLGMLVNAIKRRGNKKKRGGQDERQLLSGKHLFMMWHAGLRGGIALALNLEVGPWADEIDGLRTRQTLRNSTFFVICIFLLGFGGTTGVMLRRLRISVGIEVPHDRLYERETTEFLRFIGVWIHDHVFAPVLVGDERLKQLISGKHSNLHLEEVLGQAVHGNWRHMQDRHEADEDEEEMDGSDFPTALARARQLALDAKVSYDLYNADNNCDGYDDDDSETEDKEEDSEESHACTQCYWWQTGQVVAHGNKSMCSGVRYQG